MRLVATLLVALLLAACTKDAPAESPQTSKPVSTRTSRELLSLETPAFGREARIPREYTCDGSNHSPQLIFHFVPENSTSIAMIMEDPDAPSGTIQHWRFWNLPANVTEVPKAADMEKLGAKVAKKYAGPCPPAGQHRYFFYAFTLDARLDLSNDASVDQLRSAMKGHVTGQDSYFGTYLRPNVLPG